MRTYRKKLIEVALPLAAINAASAKEKSIRHGHPSTLHLWWARRPLAAARAVLFGQLVDDPSSWPELFPTEAIQNHERQRLFRIIEDLVQWENSNNEVILDAARLEIARSHARATSSRKARRMLAEDVTRATVDEYLATELPPVHDPFAGGGTIPLEAQRLGLRAIATDLNPVAVMINKALVEIPARFADLPPVSPGARGDSLPYGWKGAAGLAADVRYYGSKAREQAKKRIGKLYPDVRLPEEHGGGLAVVVAWIWARTVPSPDPAFAEVNVPLVTSYWLCTRPGRKAWLIPVVSKTEKTWRYRVAAGEPHDPVGINAGTKRGRGDFTCLMSGAPIPAPYVREMGQRGRMGVRLLAVVAEGNSGRIYLDASDEMEAAALSVTIPESAPRTELPAQALGFRVQNYGLRRHADLFTPRQLVALTTFAQLSSEMRAEVLADIAKLGDRDESYADAITLYLAFAVSKATTRNCALALWESGMGRLAGALGRQALTMIMTFAETNPLAGAGGDFEGTAFSVAEVLESLAVGPPGTVSQGDAIVVQDCRRDVAVVNTDPPYYDNIGYADLSDWFYTWLRPTLGPLFPETFRTVLTPKSEELVAEPARFDGSSALAAAHFEQRLSSFFRALRATPASEAPIVIYYAFKQQESAAAGPGSNDVASSGWERMLSGLVEQGFEICGTWPIRTEQSSGLREENRNALASSIVLVCRERSGELSTTRGDFRRALRRELPDALKKLQQGNIAPVDVAQASIGPGMAIFSRHKQVLEADGSAMTVRSALQLINEVLDEYLASSEGDFDADTRFAITWYEQHGWEPGPFGDAETLAKARNVSVGGVVEAGICKSAAGKVRILTRHEMRPLYYEPAKDERPTIWEFTQHMIRLLEEDGESAAAALLKKLGAAADATRELAYRLYNTCERKKWAEDARSYNALILAWPELEKLGAKLGTEAEDEATTASGKASRKTGTKKQSKNQQNLFKGDE
jgi:putative DNA methylase